MEINIGKGSKMPNCTLLPEISWFEMEILSQLVSGQKFGNEILQKLNVKFGEGSVSSGKLYPALQKMEKKGYIKRVKSKIKEKGGVKVRGVERVYFSITAEGTKELESATSFSSLNFIDNILFNLQNEVISRVLEIVLGEIEKPVNNGIVLVGDSSGLIKELQMFPALKNFNYFVLEIQLEDDENVLTTSEGSFQEPPIAPSEPSFEITNIPSKVNDFPLKSDYLDGVFIIMALHHVRNWDAIIKESLRVTRKGGLLMIIDFAKFDSYILESLMRNILSGGRRPKNEFTGMDQEEIAEFVSKLLDDVNMEKMKEIFLVYGKKPER